MPIRMTCKDCKALQTTSQSATCSIGVKLSQVKGTVSPFSGTCKHKRHCYTVKSTKEYLIFVEDLKSTF